MKIRLRIWSGFETVVPMVDRELALTVIQLVSLRGGEIVEAEFKLSSDTDRDGLPIYDLTDWKVTKD